MDKSHEDELTGGGMTQVSRSGDVVYRSRGVGSDRVEELLTRLERAGFEYSPRFLGIAADGRQMLQYMPGEAGTYPLSAAVRSLPSLRSAAHVLRRLHDLTEDLAASMVGDWMLPDIEPCEVICHGDFAPYNCVFDGEQIAAVIDFDTAHTGPRLRDLAYALYRFAPLTDPRNAVSFGTVDDQASRARVFVDTYGLEDRSGLIDAVCDRLRDLVDFMRTRAASGDSNFAGHLEDGHDTSYLRDVDYLTRHAERITRHLLW